jgi:hypothetical protein
MKLQLRMVTACAVSIALALSGCSSDADETQDTAAAAADTSTEGSVPSDSIPGASGAEASAGGDLCATKRDTGAAVLDAMGNASDAIDDGDVDAVREAYVVYYDAYEADVDAIVELSVAIRDDPTVPDDVVAGAEEAIQAGGTLFDETVARARSGLESADSVEEIRQVFTDFNDDLRGTPPDFNPQLLPPELVRWSMESDSPCEDG